MDRHVGAEIEAALLHAHHAAERSIESARQRVLARERDAYDLARRSIAARARELSSDADELGVRLHSVELACCRLGEAMASVARRVAEIGPQGPPHRSGRPREARRLRLTYSESRSVSLDLEETATAVPIRPPVGRFAESAPVAVLGRERDRPPRRGGLRGPGEPTKGPGEPTRTPAEPTNDSTAA